MWVNLIKTGKSERSLEITESNETVILFRYSHSVSYHAPNASEGTKNMIENNGKSDKIILICIRSDRIVF